MKTKQEIEDRINTINKELSNIYHEYEDDKYFSTIEEWRMDDEVLELRHEREVLKWVLNK